MECNKDEASRAKAIAERKLTEKDYAGAKKFALKAQALYPGIEDLPQLIMTLDVYISAENKISGEVDWYGVLGVTPTADDEIVKKQYRKLALMLHPDKNKAVGADGAFKLLSEAWSLLSDKAKRLAYNQRRSSNGFSNSSTSYVKTQNPMPRANPISVPPPSGQRPNTFWTICQKCKMHYEYLRTYQNQTLVCPHCRKPFRAIETAPPSKYKPPNMLPQQRNQKPPHHPNVGNPGIVPNTGLGGSAVPKFHHGSVSRTAGTSPTVSSPFVSAKAANVVQQASEKLKRAREESQGAGGWDRPWEKRRGLYGNVNGYVGNNAPQMATGSRPCDFPGGTFNAKSTRELTPLETREMLMRKARTEIQKKLTEWSLETSSKAVEVEKKKPGDINQKKITKENTQKKHGKRVSNSSKGGDQSKTSFVNTPADPDKDEVAIDVPDPDFHDFDQDRTESSFGENQVWAAYDDDDGMPRFYAMVHKVISRKPFKLRISWLNSKTNNEFSTIRWMASGFYKSCGHLWVGKHESTKSLNSFSHRVKFAKAPTGYICILPKKGDVWALYQNWSPDWNEHTPDEVIHKYNMVEVLEDYSEDQGVSVAPLTKVAGFRTVFRTCSDPENVRRIPKEEMFRFSHQVPNHLLTGEEAKDAPKGCQELDPASTPFELIQESNDDKQKNCVEKKEDEHMIDNLKEIKEEVIGKIDK